MKTTRVTLQETQRIEEEIEAGDRRLADIERRGIELDREHQEAVEASEVQQQINNGRFEELKATEDK